MGMRLLLAGMLMACLAFRIGADEKPAATLDSAALRKLVDQLASPAFATREKATEELSRLGEVPESLREAAKSSDAEVSQRAQAIIDVITSRIKDRTFKALFRWAVAKDFDSNEPHEPLVVNDIVCVGTDKGHLRAYRAKDGKLAWVHDHGQRIYHRPASDGKLVYFTSAKGLTAVKIADGSEVWSLSVGYVDGPTHVLPKLGIVVVGGSDGTLYALDLKTGKQAWASDFLLDAPADPPDFPGKQARLTDTKARPSALASDGETLFLSVFDQSRVVAINAADGKRKWAFQARGWVHGSAVASATHVFFGSQDKSFYCVEKRTGRKVWSHETNGRIEYGGVVDGNFVYFGSCDGAVYSLDQADGTVRWRFVADKRDGRISPIYSVPVLREGVVCFAATEGQVYAVDRQTGKLNWKLRPSDESEVTSSLATNGNWLFLTTCAKGKGRGEASLVAIGAR